MVHKRYCTSQGGCIEVPWRTGRGHRPAMWVRVCKSAQEMPGGSGRMQRSTGWVLQKCAGVYERCPIGWEWGTGCRAGVHQRCKGVQNGLGRLNGGAQVAGIVQVQRGLGSCMSGETYPSNLKLSLPASPLSTVLEGAGRVHGNHK